MSIADVAEVAGAACTAVAALAALATVRQVAAQNKTAREALEADTRPLLTEVPRGRERQSTSITEDGEPVGWEDVGEVSVGSWGGPELVASASVPVRNVGNGAARIELVTFDIAGGGRAVGFIDNPILPRGEVTRAKLGLEEGHPDYAVAEAIGAQRKDFSVTIEYSDVSHRPQGSIRLRVRNGKRPRVGAVTWTDP